MLIDINLRERRHYSHDFSGNCFIQLLDCSSLITVVKVKKKKKDFMEGLQCSSLIECLPSICLKDMGKHKEKQYTS